MQPSLHSAAFLVFVVASLCAKAAFGDDATMVSEPLRSAKENGKFQKLPESQTGLNVTYRIDMSESRKHLYTSGLACGGLAAGDVDGDGLPDLFFCGTAAKSRLFINRGDFQFEDSSGGMLERFASDWASGASLSDIDNDGDLDVYVCNYDAPNRCFLNDGSGVFVEKAAVLGLDAVDAFIAPYFADYDRDGDLDVFLLTNRYYSPTGFPASVPDALNAEQSKYFQLYETNSGTRDINIVPRRDRLFRNDSGKFTEVSEAAGFRAAGHGLSAAWWDYNGDGWPDLYVCNDFDDPDMLYRNNGDGTFTDVIAEVMPHTSWFSMGSDVADINNDGLLDFLAADMSATTHFKDKTTMGAMGLRTWVMETPPRQYMRNALYMNTGLPRFMEAAYLTGLAETDWTWAVKFADFDCNGRVDVFFTNGMTRNFNNSDIPFLKKLFTGKSEWSHYEKTPTRPEQNLAFSNRAEFEFEDISKDWGLDFNGMSFAAATADFDSDGDLDLAVVNMDEEAHLYRNDVTADNRIVFDLKGTKSNRAGIGAVLTIKTTRGIQTRQLQPMTGFKSHNEPGIWFGLGKQTKVQNLTIQWPSGTVQVIENLNAGNRYAITEKAQGTIAESNSQPLFVESAALSNAQHKEQLFNDFSLQPLLPNKLSQLGPGTAWGDVDGDGDDDFFVGGALGKMGELHSNLGDGSFRKSTAWTFADDFACEDMGALFFDADSDGDSDLYVVSGGVEAPPGHEIYRDRLYLNNGRGYFTKSTGRLPDLRDSGSCVCAADFDRDGDLDLFVGGRVVPGQYPVAPQSRILVNHDGKFEDGTASVAPRLGKTGMVTGAVWSDHDGDGWVDLVVAHEWGPVKVFRNESGLLRDKTDAAGLAKRTGWWNGIAAGDLNNDGNIDYVATNFGLNTKYRVPAILHYGDLDGSGKMRIAEAEFENGICYPIRGKSCSTRAMPALRQRFPSFEKFALASLEEVYTKNRIENSLRLEANTLESAVFLNDGAGKFSFHPLPRLAQIAPSFGVLIADLNADGSPDILLAQNFFSPQVETGRMDGGLGLMLMGDGSGAFEPVAPQLSGIVVPEDAASLTSQDLDADGIPDVVFGINDAPVRAFRHALSERDSTTLSVRLKGKPGNPSAIGTRVRVQQKDGGILAVKEWTAGEGYLSQSPQTLMLKNGDRTVSLSIRWPDGSESSHRIEGAGRVVLEQP